MKRVAISAGFAVMAAAGALFFALHSGGAEDRSPAAILAIADRAQEMASQGQFTEARDLLRESLRHLDRNAPAADSAPAFLATLSALAMVEDNLEQWPDAETHARRQIALAEGAAHVPAQADYVDLGAALYGKGDRAGADAAYAKAVELAASPAERANVHLAIAFYYHKHHDEKPAIDHAQKGSVLAERTLGINDPTTLTFELALAKILLADNQRELALPTAEKVLPIIEKGELGPLALGDARFAVARALPDNEIARARQLAERARQALAQAGPDGAEHAQEVAKWLAEHPP